jgi:Family of unknown function (DUF5681)
MRIYVYRPRLVNRPAFVNENPPDYRVGYRKPPLHSRFRKGQSGNPEGGRLHRSRDRRLAALLVEALDARVAGRRRRPLTRRQAVVMALVEKSAAGDLRAIKLLLDLVLKTELAAPPPDPDADDPRAFLLHELTRLAAAKATEDVGGTEQAAAGEETPSRG